MAGAKELECKELLRQLQITGNTSAEIFLWDTDSWAIAFVFGDGTTSKFESSFRILIP